MRKLVAPLFDELEQKINQGSPLAMLAVQLACTYEHQRCKSWAKSKWEQLLKSSTENMCVRVYASCIPALPAVAILTFFLLILEGCSSTSGSRSTATGPSTAARRSSPT